MRLLHNPDVFNYVICVAVSEGQNPDMQGYAVRLSNFVANVCLAILIRWSEENIEESLSVIMLQVYTILVSTFVSMSRRNLSVADAHFALTSTFSPLAVYIIYASVRKVARRHTRIYARISSYKVYVALSLLLPILWLVVDVLIYSASVFPRPCTHVTLRSWLGYRLVMLVIAFDWNFVVLPIIPFFWIVYFLRHFKDIRAEYRSRRQKVQLWNRLRWVQRIFSSTKSFMLAQWDVITKGHTWILYFAVGVAYVSWFSSLLLWVVYLDRWFVDLANSLHPPQGPIPYPPDEYDPLTFGQLLAAAVAVQPLYKVLVLAWERRRALWTWIESRPLSLWNGVVFIITGRRNPWHEMLDAKLEDGEGDHSSVSLPLRDISATARDPKSTSTSQRQESIPLTSIPSHPDVPRDANSRQKNGSVQN